MLDRLREWLSTAPAEKDDDGGWGLSLWWGAVVVALFTVAISICNDPAPREAVAAPSTTASPPSSPTEVPEPIAPNLLELIESRGDLTFFRSLIAAAGIDQNIQQGSFTFFAPNDAAFEQLPAAVRSDLQGDPIAAINLLGAHVTLGRQSAADIVAAGSVVTGLEETLPVSTAGDAVFIGELEVLEADLIASNGIVHVVDAIRDPSLVQPPVEPPDAEPVPVSQILVEREDLSTLAAALTAAEGATLLEADEAGFTVFAPNNAAFDALPEGSVEVLIATQPKLIELLGYHVVAGRFPAADLENGQVLVTASGAELPIAIDGESLTVGGALVTEPDIEGVNGLVHIVDGVLIPPDFVLPTINEALSLDPVTFETSSATITAAGIEVLQRAVEFLTANPEVRVMVEGHTDSQGGESANQALSEARAESVRDYLIGQGVDGARLETAGFGESRPIADNGTAAGRAQNRRIEFRLL